MRFFKKWMLPSSSHRADKTYRMLVTECNNPGTWDPATNNQLWQFRRATCAGMLIAACVIGKSESRHLCLPLLPCDVAGCLPRPRAAWCW